MRTSKESVGLVTNSVRSLSSAMRNMGIAVTAASAISGAAMLTLSRRAERVNAAFREVNSITSEVEDSQEEYGELVSRLNTEFGLQANRMQVIDGLYQSISAGVDESVEAQEEFLTTAAQLSAVGLVDLETSVDVLSTAINAYGEDTDFAEEAASSLFQTVQFGKVTLDELAPVMGRITALGGEMNIAIDELGASMAVLTRTGFEARIAATGLRAIMRGFMRPSEEMQEILRDIALDQDLFAETMGESSESIRNLAEDYREATDRLRDLEQAQSDARREIRESSLVVQEARLLQTAIERDAREEAEQLIQTEELKGQTYEELEETIDDFAFKTESLRVEEEQLNLESEKVQENVENLENEFSEAVGASGDLEGGLGQLVLENQGLIDTLIELRERADEQGISFDELFPRTRALQGALALVGEDGSLLMEIFDEMKDGTIDAEEAWADMDETARDNFDSFEDFQEVAKEMETFDLDEEFDDIRGEQEAMQDATSELGEAAEDLGQVFNEEVTEAISDFAGAIQGVVDRIDSMEESARSGIGRFAVLATSIGLVLGPLLLLGGQIALIASAMGVGLIPFLAIAGTLFGSLAAGLHTATEGGEDAEGLFESMEGTLSGLIEFISLLGTVFTSRVLPAMRFAGAAFSDLLGDLSEEFDGFFDSTGDGTSVLFDLADVFRELFLTIGNFLDENSDEIVEYSRLIVDFLVEEAIPAFQAFAAGVIAIISDINWVAIFGMIAFLIGSIIPPIVSLIGWLGRLMQNNSNLIANLITVGAVLAGLAFGLFKIVALIGKAATAIQTIIPLITGWLGFLSRLLMAKNTLAAVLNVLTFKGFPALAKGIAIIVGGFGGLVKVLGVVVGAFATLFSAVGLAPAILFAVAIAGTIAIWKFRDEIHSGLASAWSAFINFFNNVADLGLDLVSQARNWGENIIDSIVFGLRDGISRVKDAMSTVADAISGFLPSSPADEGPLSDNPPGESGQIISEDMASGMMDGVPDIEASSEDLAEASVPDTEDVEFDSSADGTATSSISSDAVKEEKTEVTVEEGAIKVGPFEGIADDELPGKVRDEVDESLDQIIEDLRARGGDPN